MEDKIVNVFMNEIREIRFENVEDLFKRREFIRQKYLQLDRNYKEMYKWYFFYQLCIIKKLDLKRALWYYINSEEYDMQVAEDVLKEYSKFHREKEKIKIINQEEKSIEILLNM